jgi:probable HAF family extracellular repeat protein
MMRHALLRSVKYGVLCASCVLLAPPALAQQPSFQVQDLGTLGGRFTEPASINDAGAVTGYSEMPDGQIHAFVYDNGVMRDLGTLGGTGSLGRSINRRGEITGFALTGAGEARAFRYSGGTMSDLGTLAGSSSGNAINIKGEIAGESALANGAKHAVLFAGGGINDLGTMGDSSTAVDMNDAGQLVGTFDDSNGTHAFLHRGGRSLVDLVPGRASFVSGTRAINEAGDVIGGINTNGLTRAFIYRNGRLEELGTLGGDYSVGVAINDEGTATGIAARPDGARHAFLYANGTMTDLGTLGGNISVGYTLNDVDQVAGSSLTADGAMHAFISANGILLDLGPLIEQLGTGDVIESVAFDVNTRGDVIGRYSISDPTDAQMPVKTRGFIATPRLPLFDKLLGLVNGLLEPGKRLLNELLRARVAFLANDTQGTCKAMKSFTQEVKKETGRKIDLVTALLLTVEANLVRVTLGCS